jgi:RHS repeat-associated protein
VATLLRRAGRHARRACAGGAYEVVTDPTGKRTRKVTIAGVAMVIDEVVGATVTPVGTRYLLKDHLGSVDLVTDQTGAVLDRMSFDAWGRRRNIDWTALVGSVSDAYPWQSQLVTRGYTFHEQLDPIGLGHMNGRVYDPEIGRFLSADIAIQDISNSQSLNAYSYVWNNPLSFTDPSGFFLSGLFHKIGNFFRSVAHAIGRVVRSTVFRSVLTILACATPGVNVVACAAMAATISFGGALVDGGSFGDAIRSASVAFFSAGLFQGGGDFLQGLGLGGNIFARAAVQGTIGGAMSVMGGGSFSAGFYSNAFGAVANGFTEGLGNVGAGRIGRIAIAATVGGTASVLAGGKFANGAMSAAFALMYNDMQHGPGNCKGPCPPEATDGEQEFGWGVIKYGSMAVGAGGLLRAGYLAFSGFFAGAEATGALAAMEATLATDAVRTVAGYQVGGNAGLVRSTYNVNIWGLYRTASSEGSFAFINALRAEAVAAGASEISIIGAAVRNPVLMNINQGVATRLGLTFTRVDATTIKLFGKL